MCWTVFFLPLHFIEKVEKMRVRNFIIVCCLVVAISEAGCKQSTPKVAPISFDLPVSYKSDSAAYYFIKEQEVNWKEFGKKIETMYNKGERFRKKEFTSLSQKELFDLVKLDYEYALVWTAQDLYIDVMVLKAKEAAEKSSKQGIGKITEAQRIIFDYYNKLALSFGKDLNLDKEPYILTPEEDSLRNDKLQSQGDSLLLKMLPPEIPEIKDQV